MDHNGTSGIPMAVLHFPESPGARLSGKCLITQAREARGSGGPRARQMIPGSLDTSRANSSTQSPIPKRARCTMMGICGNKSVSRPLCVIRSRNTVSRFRSRHVRRHRADGELTALHSTPPGVRAPPSKHAITMDNMSPPL